MNKLFFNKLFILFSSLDIILLVIIIKKVFFLSIIIFILPFMISYASNDKTIAIDAGHDCVYDRGASVGDVYEGVINLAIANELADLFRKEGVSVVMTREDGNHLCEDKFIKKEDMNKRCQIIEDSNCELFLSIHLNYFPSSNYKGSEIYYSSNNSNNELLANIILNQIKTELNNTSRNIKKTDSLYLLNNTTRPGCLIECGFMSNEEELALLQTKAYQKLIAKAIFDGAMLYLNIV